MKKRIVAIAVCLLGLSSTGQADNGFHDTARVLRTTPIYETVSVNQPRERCWNERVTHRQPRQGKSYTPSIAGAIIGGAVGNQFGKGSGKDAMTVAGAILGASIGNDLGGRGGRGRAYTTTERRCERVDDYRSRQELVGYRVKYKYNGKVFWTEMDHHPGETVRVRVSVDPARDRHAYNSGRGFFTD